MPKGHLPAVADAARAYLGRSRRLLLFDVCGGGCKDVVSIVVSSKHVGLWGSAPCRQPPVQL
jgi:hypothetical protein